MGSTSSTGTPVRLYTSHEGLRYHLPMSNRALPLQVWINLLAVTGIASVMVVLTFFESIIPFFLDLGWRSIIHAVNSNGNTAIGIIGSLSYPISDLIIELRKNGKDGMRRLWKRHLRRYFYVAAFWWSIVFLFHFAYTVPKEIRDNANTAKLPGRDIALFHRPSKPDGWDMEITKILKKKEEPFTVSVEWAMFSLGGKGYGTGLWAYYPSPTSCTISPIQAVFFIRVKNLRSTPLTVIGYRLDVLGTPLTRTNMGSIVWISQKGSSAPRRRSGDPINTDINFGQGPGFSMVQFPLNETDFTRGALLKMDLIEDLLKSPLQPNVPIRGWAFYQSPNADAYTVAGPGHITLETDDSRTFSYDFNLRNPHSDMDILDRVITFSSAIDLSNCKRP
jgi:hypothetical protein